MQTTQSERWADPITRWGTPLSEPLWGAYNDMREASRDMARAAGDRWEDYRHANGWSPAGCSSRTRRPSESDDESVGFCPLVRLPWQNGFSLWGRTSADREDIELNHGRPCTHDEEQKLEDEISSVERQISRLRQIAMSKKSELYQLRSAHAPINNLPDDVLGYIFELGCKGVLQITLDEGEEGPTTAAEPPSSPGFGWGASSDAVGWGGQVSPQPRNHWARDPLQHCPIAFIIGQVCRRWRRVSQDRPILWSNISFTRLDRGIFPSQVILARSKQAPLRITFAGITCRGRAWKALNTILDSCLSRTQSLQLKGCGRWQSYFLSRRPVDAPLLEDLSIELAENCSCLYREGTNPTQPSEGVLFTHTPRLRHIRYSGKLYSSLRRKVPNIQGLTTIFPRATSLSSVYDLLVEYNDLSTVSLQLPGYTKQYRPQPSPTESLQTDCISLDKLRKCHIQLSIDQFGLFFHLSMPTLDTLSLEVSPYSLDDFTPPCHNLHPLPNLNRLTLKGFWEAESMIVLRAATALRSLCVSGKRAAYILWPLSDVQQGRAVVVPDLKELRIARKSESMWQLESRLREIVTARQTTACKIRKVDFRGYLMHLPPDTLEWYVSQGVTLVSDAAKFRLGFDDGDSDDSIF